MSYKEINAMRKEGNLQQALAMAEAEYSSQPDKYSAVALFWCLNTIRKNNDDLVETSAIIDRMTELWKTHAPENDVLKKTIEVAKDSISPQAIAERKAWRLFSAAKEASHIEEKKDILFQYIKTNNVRPSLLHSLVLGYAIGLKKETPALFNMQKFVELWNLSSLREEDWIKPEAQEGRTMYSLVEKLLTALVKEALESKKLPSSNVMLLLDQAIEQFPQNLHLARHKAQLLVLAGNKEEAQALYKKLLLKKPDTFYLWDELASLVDDPELKLGMLCAAILSGVTEEFMPKIRVKLAHELCNRRLYPNARMELKIVENTYARNGWSKTSDYVDACMRIPPEAMAVDNRELYAHFKMKAMDYLYADFPTSYLVKLKDMKEQVNGRQSLSWQMRGENGMVWVNPKRFRLDFRSPKGSIFRAKMAKDQVIWIEPAEFHTNLPWLRKTEGPLTIKNGPNGKYYGFVDGVFVTGNMLIGRSNGENMSILAVRNPDDRWGAILAY